MVDSAGVHADPVHPIDVLLGLNLANGQGKVCLDVVVWHCHAKMFHRSGPDLDM